MSRAVDVFLSTAGADVLVGRAFFATNRRGISTTFRYDDAYLTRRAAYALDPALPLFKGNHAIADGLPYSFADCTPDRWGRNLIKKRLQALDVAERRTRREVTDIDFLLGVTDLTRQGALRFTEPDAGCDGPFLAVDPNVPKVLELPRLLRAAEQVVRDENDMGAIKELLDAGTGSLGGARPKASVRDGNRLLIAKFASPRDEWDVIAWEKTALDLAERAGIHVPTRRLERIDGKAVLLMDRFDRAADGSRIAYISAMTLLTTRDGGDETFDYTDLAETLPEHGNVTIKADLIELWRRIAFSVAIHNTDDHLRNHGFLRGKAGWGLSPLFDVNPNPDVSVKRETTIGFADGRDDEISGLMDSAPVFGLDADQAKRILTDVFSATEAWRRVAKANGITERQVGHMKDAFEGLRHEIG
ncbi:type II toxin-antitoxin system HipA family toxin [Phytoactinopolyspora limicola]|uniref:type II toxin-antitoxin system HipA family toxin n=1 Tax=Phytoactinopolyspora limicola TaxID=2715536 RepID=UPI00140747C1|nr:type II toxin-antitoxin system HipA family toxin [Phytoactinopolyspora limicola]